MQEVSRLLIKTKIAILTIILAEEVRKAMTNRIDKKCSYFNFKTFKLKNHKKLYEEQLLLSEVYKERADFYYDKSVQLEKQIERNRKRRNGRIF